MKPPQGSVLRIVSTTQGRDFWAARPYVPEDLRARIRTADVIFIPIEGFRGRAEPLYPVGTADLIHFFQDKMTAKLNIEVLTSDEDYKELALHSELVIIGRIVSSLMLAPTIIALISEYLKARFLLVREEEGTTVRFQLQVTEGSKSEHDYSIDFQGLANKFQEQMSEAIRTLTLPPLPQGEPQKAVVVAEGVSKTRSHHPAAIYLEHPEIFDPSLEGEEPK